MLNKLILWTIVSFIVVSCSTNAITGRSQLKLMPESQLQQMAATEYQTFLSSNHVITTAASNGREAEMVNRVGQRIINAVTQYFRQNNLSQDLQGYQWETKLVQSDEVNAWCMPGGKIVVYTGLLPITQNEAALANVLGHEVSHALFGHTNERVSQTLMVQYGTNVTDALLSAKSNNALGGIVRTGVGIGGQVGVLAFSRKQELEADHYGMIWAAIAGYDPHEAIGLWQRMQAKAGSGNTPEFLSTHPGPERRIEQLQTYLPEAMKYYKPQGR